MLLQSPKSSLLSCTAVLKVTTPYRSVCVCVCVCVVYMGAFQQLTKLPVQDGDLLVS